MEELTQQRLEFKNRLEEHMQKNLCRQRRDKYVITRELKNTALSLLRMKKGEKCSAGARLKFWVHEKFYAQGSVLKCKKSHKPVVVKEDLFDIIHETHCSSGHLKASRTWNMLYKEYAYVKRDIVHIYIATCKVCRRCPLPQSPLPTKNMVPRQHNMTRVAVSLINMEDMPDCGYRFILLLRDCCTRFVTAWPLRDISGDLVTCLLQHFGQFGPARYVHFEETGCVGAAKELAKLKDLWPGLVVLEGCDDYPEIAEMSERACADIQNKLGAWMAQVDSDSWSKGLGPAVFLMNSAITSETNTSSFQSVFLQPHLQTDLQWKAVAFYGYKKETELPESLRETKKEPIVEKDNDETDNSSIDDNDSQLGKAPLCKITNIQSGSVFWNKDKLINQEDTE